MQEQEYTVLIFADLNPRASIAVARSLKRAGIKYVFAVSSRLSQILSFPIYSYGIRSRTFFYTKNNEQEFIKSLLLIKKSIAGQLILYPTGEKILRWVLQHKDILKTHSINIPINDLKSYKTLSDKYKFLDLVKKYSVPIPEELNQLPKHFSFKYVVKPKFATWGDKYTLEVPLIVDSELAHIKVLQMNLNIENHIVQHYIEGDSVYYCALYNSGQLICSFSQKTLIQQPGGLSVIKAIPFDLPQNLVDASDLFFKDLNWTGVAMIEYKGVQDKYYAIECNPRFWGPLQCALDNNVDFPMELYQVACGFIGDRVYDLSVSREEKQIIVGYVWYTGFFDGLFKKVFTNTLFKRSNFVDEKNQKYYDVWLRKDTFVYFFSEPLIITVYNIYKAIVRLKGRLVC